jgi:hypothetical protein
MSTRAGSTQVGERVLILDAFVEPTRRRQREQSVEW